MELSSLIKIGLIAGSLLVIGVGKFFFHVKEDSPIEQVAEYCLDKELGIPTEKKEPAEDALLTYLNDIDNKGNKDTI